MSANVDQVLELLIARANERRRTIAASEVRDATEAAANAVSHVAIAIMVARGVVPSGQAQHRKEWGIIAAFDCFLADAMHALLVENGVDVASEDFLLECHILSFGALASDAEQTIGIHRSGIALAQKVTSQTPASPQFLKWNDGVRRMMVGYALTSKEEALEALWKLFQMFETVVGGSATVPPGGSEG